MFLLALPPLPALLLSPHLHFVLEASAIEKVWEELDKRTS